MDTVSRFPREVWTEDAPCEVYLAAGSGVPVWAAGGYARVDGWTVDGREMYAVEVAGRVVGWMTMDGEFTEL